MATQRPLLPLLVTFYQTALEHPLGASAQVFERALDLETSNQELESVPAPTRSVALRQAVLLEVLRAEGQNRGRRYFPGTQNPGLWDEEELARRLQAASGSEVEQVRATPKVTSGQTKSKKVTTQSDIPMPLHVQQYQTLKKMVWSIADILRDKSNLQVDAYRPITLVKLALKRNMDTSTWLFQTDDANASLLDSGMRTGVEIAQYINQATEIFDPDIFVPTDPRHNKACVPLMQWKDLVTFPNTDKPKRDEPITLRLAANPPGKSWFTYTTTAGNQQALIEELVSLHAAALREAFSAIGLHAALVPSDPHAARLSSEVLGQLVEQLDQIDLSPAAIPGDVFSDVYMDLLGRFAEASGKKGGDFFTPMPLIKGALRFFPIDLIAQELFSNPHKYFQIADPTAGAGTLLTAFFEVLNAASIRLGLGQVNKQQLTFHAQELTHTQAGLLVFNFVFHRLARRLALVGATEEATGRPLSATGTLARVVGNTITEYVNKIGRQSGKVDFLFANPPYGTNDYGIEAAKSPVDTDKRWHVGAPTRSEGEWAFINTCVDLLSSTGKGIIVLPLGVLFRDGGKMFRQYVVEKNWIEGVVTLPSNQFLTTQIPVCLMFLNKDPDKDFAGNPRRHGVFFVNASEDFTKTGKLNHWDQDRSVEAWWKRSEIPGYSGFISIDKLRDIRNDYKLAVNRYFASVKEREKLDPAVIHAQVSNLETTMTMRSNWLKDLFVQAISARTSAARDEAHPGEQS